MPIRSMLLRLPPPAIGGSLGRFLSGAIMGAVFSARLMATSIFLILTSLALNHPANARSFLQPNGISQCRPTYIMAVGKDTVVADTPAQAVSTAQILADNDRAAIDARAQGLRCPPAPCIKHGPPVKTGAGLDWTTPTKVLRGPAAGRWTTTATAYFGYSYACSLPRVQSDWD